jgi:predicted dehydrogenase
MKLRVGLIGLGPAWTSRYLPALRSLVDRFDVRAVCEQVAHRAEQAAKEFKAQPVEGYRALAARRDVDAVLMLSSQWYGALPILAACEFRKSVYCAATLDLDPAEARRIKDRVDGAGVAFMSEFARRHAAATLRLKELIATRLGRPRLLFCHQRIASGATDQANDRAWGNHCPLTSPTNDLMQLVDWCRYVVGQEPTSVFGTRHQRDPQAGPEDYEMMNLDFSEPGCPGSGAMAQISCGRYMPAAWPEAVAFRPPAALQVACEHGIAFIDLPSTLIWFDGAGRHMESLDSERPVGEHLLMQFHRAVTSLVRSTASIEDTYRSLSVVLSARESFVKGQRMPIEY